MAHRIANNGMRNFTHHQPLSVLQAIAHCHHTTGTAPPSLEARPVTVPARCPAGPSRDSNSACNLLTTKLPN
jgi:hypothetical protein